MSRREMRQAAAPDGTEGEGAPFNANLLAEVTVERLNALQDQAQEHSHHYRANAILGTRCRNMSQIRRWPVLGVGNNVERARGVANGDQAS